MSRTAGQDFFVALWYAVDAKRYGYYEILHPTVQDLKQLESDGGTCNNREVIHGVVVLVSADNLRAYPLFGFSNSFSVNKFCKLCEMVRSDVKYLETECVL
jgi:hypothetical protein